MACEYYESIKLDHVPEGWKVAEAASSPFYGYKWIHNGKSRFTPGHEYQHALVPEAVAASCGEKLGGDA